MINAHGSLQEGLEFQINLPPHDPDVVHVPGDSHPTPLPADATISDYLNFVRAHCGR